MSYETIVYKVNEGVATIALYRPDKMNAFTKTMAEELIKAFDAVDADDAVKAVVVTGEGKAFCAGADLSAGGATFTTEAGESSAVKPDGTLDYTSPSARDWGGILTLRIYKCLKPVIAAINGPAVGIGVTMTLPMDVRIASENAKMGLVFTRRGIVPEAASMYFLPRVIGISQALQWCYSGKIFSSAEALSGGLVSEVVPEGELLNRAHEIAREFISESAPVSVALVRQMMWRSFDLSHPMEAHKIDSRALLSRGQSEDPKEGVLAFLEKRKADFPCRVSTDMPDFFPWWDEPEYS